MRLRTLILTSLRSLKRNIKRSILTMLGISIGIAAVIMIVSIGEGYREKTIKDFTGNKDGEVVLVTNFVPKDGKFGPPGQFITKKDADILEGVEGVDSVEPVYNQIGAGVFMQGDLRGTPIKGAVEGVEFTNEQDIYGRNLTQADNDRKRNVVFMKETVLPKDTVAKKMIGAIITLDGKNYEIVGVKKALKEDETSSIFSLESPIKIPKATNDRFSSSEKPIANLKIILKPRVDVSKTIEKIKNILNEEGSSRASGKYEVQDTSGMVKILGTVLNTITTFIAIVASISLFIAGIGVMNMVYTSVSERSLEIGIKRALGAKRRDIRREFLLEGVMITLTGGAIGYLAGMFFAFIASIFLELSIKPSILTISIAVSISVAVGVLSSFLPAKKAANQNTVDILK